MLETQTKGKGSSRGLECRGMGSACPGRLFSCAAWMPRHQNMYSVDIKQGYAGVSVSFAARALRVSGSHKRGNGIERKKNHIEL